MKRALLTSLLLVCGSAFATDMGVIYTAKVTGSYHTKLAPMLEKLLSTKAFNYSPQASEGSATNVALIAKEPTNLALAQLDVVMSMMQADPSLNDKIEVVRQGVVDECLFAVVTPKFAETINNWGDVRRLGNRLRIATDSLGSGSDATLRFLEKQDDRFNPKNIQNLNSPDEAINAVKNGSAALAFFVMYGDPENSRFKTIQEAGLKFVPVVDRKLLSFKVADNPVYKFSDVPVTSASWGGLKTGESIKTVCTPLAYITGKQIPESDKRDQEELVQAIRNAGDADLLPREPLFARIKKNVSSVATSTYTSILDAVDKAAK